MADDCNLAARAFKAKATNSRPRPDNPRAQKFGFKAKD